jgi:acyl-CoA synthetase (AMP-forming)/AMP-acid ligase II
MVFLSLSKVIFIYTKIMNGSTHIATALRSWAGQRPDADAITDLGVAATVNYGELEQEVLALQYYFGEEPRTILMALPSGITNSILWLTCLMSGHRLVPISPDSTGFEFEQALSQHAPDLVITDQVSRTGAAQTLTNADINAVIYDHSSVPVNGMQKPRDGSVYLSTSGSTGKPKGIILTATQCVSTAQNIIASHKLSEHDRALTPLPFYHVNAPIVSLLSTILSGGQLAIAPKYSTEQFWHWVEEIDPTWISIVPTMAAMLLSTERPTFLDKAHVRFVRTASAPLPKTTLRDFEATFKLPLIETYGISEAASMIVANPIPPAIHKPGSVGLPAGIELQIYDQTHHQMVAQGKVGEIRIKGSNVITAYVDNRDEDSFVDGWFITGDLGYIDSDGYVFLTGRTKDIIIRGGENIFPREIEEILSEYPDIREAVVVGHPDELYGEKIVAYMTTTVPYTAELASQLRAFMLERMSRQKVPAEFHVLDDFPRTKAGKVDKPLLRSDKKTNHVIADHHA